MKGVVEAAVAFAAVALLTWGLWVQESLRAGLIITDRFVGDTPVTDYSLPDSAGPVVVVAHGFAGSRQMMQGYALVLAQAGYRVTAFDFEGHGRHPVPMSGDVNAIEGTTRLLVNQTQAVVHDAAQGMATVGEQAVPVAVLGHSMATDVLIRAAAETPEIGPLVLISAFSLAVTPDAPRDAIFIAGAWEPGLADFALKAAGMVKTGADFGKTVVGVNAAGDAVRRKAVLAPAADHVSVLHSRLARFETVKWLDASYGRTSQVDVPQTGWALLAILAGITLAFRPLSRLLPHNQPSRTAFGWRRTLVVAIVPMAVAPLVASLIDLQFLPVLVADYLAIHLAIYGAIQLGLYLAFGGRIGPVSGLGFGLLVIWGLGVFGLALDRYGANFWPNSERLWVIAALLPGALIFMLADALATLEPGFWRRVLLRLCFLGSLGIAVAIDFAGLFFLLMIAPVVVLYFAVFGYMGRLVAARAGPVASGVGLGIILAWALGVSFPLFSA